MSGLVHQQPVQNVGRLAHGGRNVLGGKGAELVGDMGIGLEAWLGAVFRVDEVHGFALPGGGEELPVTGRGDAPAPELGHGQPGLCLNYQGEGLVDGIALHMPSRQAGELEVVMCAGRFGHLAEPKIQTFSQQHGQHPDLVFAGRAGLQMCEGFREANICIDLLQQFGDPYGRQPVVEIEHQLVRLLRHRRTQAVSFQDAILDRPARDRPCASRLGQSRQPVGHARLAIGKPGFRVERHRQPWRALYRLRRNQGLLQISVAPGMEEPDVTRPERLPQMKQHRNLPEPMAVTGGSVQMAVPFRAAPQKANWAGFGLFIVRDQRGRLQQGSCDTRRLDIENAQHARGIAPEPKITLANMGQWVCGHRVRQLGGGGDQPFEPTPPASQLCRLIQGRPIASGVQQGRPERFEGAQGVLHRRLCVGDFGVAQPLRALPGLADDPVMGLDHRVGNRGTPLDGANRENGQAAVAADVTQTIGKVAFALTPQAGHPMGWNAREDI